jgi:hypothetical protein
MILRSSIIFGLFLFSLSCRYKENDKFVVATVKQRIEKTWHLKEYTLNGVSSYVSPNETLTFSDMIKDEIYWRTTYSDFGHMLILKNNKTRLVSPDNENGKSLKIIKLTKDELWLEGDRIIIPVTGSSTDDVIMVKYTSKK